MTLQAKWFHIKFVKLAPSIKNINILVWTSNWGENKVESLTTTIHKLENDIKNDKMILEHYIIAWEWWALHTLKSAAALYLAFFASAYPIA